MHNFIWFTFKWNVKLTGETIVHLLYFENWKSDFLNTLWISCQVWRALFGCILFVWFILKWNVNLTSPSLHKLKNQLFESLNCQVWWALFGCMQNFLSSIEKSTFWISCQVWRAVSLLQCLQQVPRSGRQVCSFWFGQTRPK